MSTAVEQKTMTANTDRYRQMQRNRRIVPKMIKLYQKGATHAAIAARFGLSRSRVQAMLAKARKGSKI